MIPTIENKIAVAPLKRLDSYMALKAFKECKAVLDGLGIEFFLIYGTLLGAVRDGGFVSTDTDIDLGVRHEELIPKIKLLKSALEAAGFKTYGFSFPYDYLRALNCYKYDTLIDIRNFEQWNGSRFLQRIEASRRDIANVWPKEMFDGLEWIDFYDTRVRIPRDSERWLEINYGPDWKKPDPNMHFSHAGVEGFWRKIGRKFLVSDKCVG